MRNAAHYLLSAHKIIQEDGHENDRQVDFRADILAVVAAGALSFGAAAQSRQFSFAYDQPKGSGYDAGADIFDKKLKELSNDAFPSINILGPPARDRSADHAKGADRRPRLRLPVDSQCFDCTAKSGVFSIHFIFRDENHAIKVLGDPKVIAAMRDLYAAKITGAHMLGLGSQGLRHMFRHKANTKCRGPQGRKDARTSDRDGRQYVSGLRRAGRAHAVRQVYTALQTGVVDMAENGINNYLINKHYEPAPVLSLTEHEANNAALFISDKASSA